MRFSFATAGEIHFGCGSVDEVARVRAWGSPLLLVSGSDPARAAPVRERLHTLGADLIEVRAAGEPDLEAVRLAAARAREARCRGVVAVGGGSALDLGKAAAALATNPGDALDYLEVVGAGRPLEAEPLPVCAVPTTAGTGSEVTRNAVVLVREERVKVSLRSPLMLPRLALVDPELTRTVPRSVTVTTGLDAVTQLVEPFTSRRSNPLVRALCREAIPRAFRALPACCARPDDIAARTDMSFASLCGGLALANAGLGAAHGFAGPLGGMLGAPHGALCARLLPAVVATNVRAMRSREPQNPALEAYAELAALLCGGVESRAEAASDMVAEFVEGLGVPRLGELGLSADQIDEAVDRAARSSSMRANPIVLTREELVDILRASL